MAELAGFATRVIHTGSEPDPVTGAVAVPISLSTTYAQRTPGEAPGAGCATSYGKGFEYSRTGNPTRGSFERALAAAEGGARCVAFASGMSATTAAIHLLSPGDTVIVIDDVYGGSQRFFRRIASPLYGLKFEFVDLTVPGSLEATLAATPTARMLWLETPTNPTLKLADIASLSTVARAAGLLVVVDNTFMSPYLQNPLSLGADLVVHSVTKYIGGHSDVVGGAIVMNDLALETRLRFIQNGLGAVPSPFDCWLAHRGLKTLHVRMDRHCSNAAAVAAALEAHPAVEHVLYPGLPSHPQHQLARTQARGFGGMITFYVRGGLPGARAFLENLHLFVCAESLGAVESLAESPAIMTHASVPAESRVKLGISDSLVRLSVGIECVEDLLADVHQALAKVVY